MENKREIYVCGVCGAVHATIAERSKCEQACVKKMEVEAAKAAEEKLTEEFNARITEIKDALNKVYELDDKLFKDYGARYLYPYHDYKNCNPYLMVLKHFLR